MWTTHRTPRALLRAQETDYRHPNLGGSGPLPWPASVSVAQMRGATRQGLAGRKDLAHCGRDSFLDPGMECPQARPVYADFHNGASLQRRL